MWKYFPKLKPTYICISVTDVHLDTVAKHRHRESVIPFQSQCLPKKDKTPQQTTLTLFFKMIKTDCFDYVLCANNTIMWF